MKQIPLNSKKYPGLFALVDDEDYDRLARLKWHVTAHHGNFYATNCEYTGIEHGKQKVIHRKMHREILRLTDSKVKIDHENGNGLDNRKENLRISDNSQNQRNRNRIHKVNTSGFRGVSFFKNGNRAKRWNAQIQYTDNGKSKRKSLGYFLTAEEAARAFDKAAKVIYGNFCGKLNFE